MPEKKDAYWFRHDSNAKDDPKCLLMIEDMGLEAFGIYWVLVEILRDQPGYKYPLALIPSIARKYNTSPEKLNKIINDYGLFKTEGTIFYSESLQRRMVGYDSVVGNNRKAAEIRWAKEREKDMTAQILAQAALIPPEPAPPVEPKPVDKPEKQVSPIAIRLAEKLKDLILKNNPKAKIPENLNGWITEIDRMMRIEKHTEAEIEAVMEFSQRDRFWMQNVLSGAKLRDKYDQLYLKMKGNNHNKIPYIEHPANHYNVKIVS